MGSSSAETVSTGPTETSCLAVFVYQIKLQATASNSPRTEIIKFEANYALIPILAKFRHKTSSKPVAQRYPNLKKVNDGQALYNTPQTLYA